MKPMTGSSFSEIYWLQYGFRLVFHHRIATIFVIGLWITRLPEQIFGGPTVLPAEHRMISQFYFIHGHVLTSFPDKNELSHRLHFNSGDRYLGRLRKQFWWKRWSTQFSLKQCVFSDDSSHFRGSLVEWTTISQSFWTPNAIWFHEFSLKLRNLIAIFFCDMAKNNCDIAKYFLPEFWRLFLLLQWKECHHKFFEDIIGRTLQN